MSLNIYLNHKLLNIIIFIMSILLIFFRDINFFIDPRFWAEEGSVYFLDAFNNGLIALFSPHQGYFSIVPNIATYISTLFSLESAPLVTTVFAFIIQAIPFYLILISTSTYFNNTLKKLTSSMIILFVAHTGEIWLNTITSQFHFILILFLIALDENKKINNKYLILVLLSGLSGVVANLLTILFLINYIYKKNRSYLIYFLILCFTSIIQLIYILSAEHSGSRFSGFDWFIFLQKLYYYSIQHALFNSTSYYLIFLSLPFFYLLYKGSKTFYIGQFFITSLILSLFMLLTSLGMNGSYRYAYVPSVLLILGLQIILFDSNFKLIEKKLASIYLIIAIAIGIYNFRLIDGQFTSTTWVSWTNEVKKYKNGESTELSIYPQWDSKHWKLKLPSVKKNDSSPL